ncbi:hypothetical protein HYX12_04200 [Candidatus Woesearchaeota archaeon]|nr:hypothetical protein [Candidatus Woesearchaeota archaeon]
MSTQKILEQVGLTGNETKVYLTLLDLGSALAGEITKKCGVNRTNVYDALDRLMEKGMASFIVQNNRKYFEATPAEQIIHHVEEQERELLNKKKAVQDILQDLIKRRNLGKQPLEATIYKGKNGLRSVTEDILREKKEFLVFGATGRFVEEFGHYAKQWHLRRGQLRIPLRIIFHDKAREKRKNMPWKLVQIRFHPYIEETPATTWIYGHKVAIAVWGEQPVVTLIRSKQVADSYRAFFELIWKEAKV